MTNVHSLTTLDQYKISLREFSDPKLNSKTCWIVVPGFLNHSQSKNFKILCKDLTSLDAAVFCLDLRGTGESEGRFSFGDLEYLDVVAAIQFAKQKYEEVKVLGFSLGAYDSLRAHCESGESVHELFLVSCPTSVLNIIFQGHGLKHCVGMLYQRSPFPKDRSFGFRWGNPFPQKPNAETFAVQACAPVHFLIGSKDFLVPPKMTSKIFAHVSSRLKTWKLVDGGPHAELLYLLNPKDFKSWLANP